MLSKNISLKSLNTFGIEVRAELYVNPGSETELRDLINDGSLSGKEILVLGGGSNILFTSDIKGIVIHPSMNRIRLMHSDKDHVYISCDAGVEWDSFVSYCVENSYGGLENLSYIPGNVGAAPIQNIGAYGAEVSDTIKSVRAIDLESGEIRIFNNTECHFAYRSSIFKTDYRGKYLITSVEFKLIRDPSVFNLSYGALEEKVGAKGDHTLNSIRETVIDIRKEKLPEPEIIGNAGSFFKNPVIEDSQFRALISDYPAMPSYPATDNRVKIPAAWLIENCGWKGHRKGDAGVYSKQSLVLVNYGKASGQEILDLSEEIIQSVEDKFGILLEREVNVV